MTQITHWLDRDIDDDIRVITGTVYEWLRHMGLTSLYWHQTHGTMCPGPHGTTQADTSTTVSVGVGGHQPDQDDLYQQ